MDLVLEAIVQHVPSPSGNKTNPLQALIFDAYYDNYRGAICFIRVKHGVLRPGMRMRRDHALPSAVFFCKKFPGLYKPGKDYMFPRRSDDVYRHVQSS